LLCSKPYAPETVSFDGGLFTTGLATHWDRWLAGSCKTDSVLIHQRERSTLPTIESSRVVSRHSSSNWMFFTSFNKISALLISVVAAAKGRAVSTFLPLFFIANATNLSASFVLS